MKYKWNVSTAMLIGSHNLPNITDLLNLLDREGYEVFQIINYKENEVKVISRMERKDDKS